MEIRFRSIIELSRGCLWGKSFDEAVDAPKQIHKACTGYTDSCGLDPAMFNRSC